MEKTGHQEHHLRDLSTVAIMDFSHAPEILLHRRTLGEHGATLLQDNCIEEITNITQQKIAVIVDQSMPNEQIEELISASDRFIDKNPDMSLRIFYLKWSQNISVSSGPRFRIIDAKKIAAYDLPIHINRSLYKARLPYFLRKGYDIEIASELLDIAGEKYRPITIKKHIKSEIDSAAEYSDKTQYVYVINKKEKKMYTVTEGGRLEQCTWDEQKINLPHSVNITGFHGVYSKEYNRFYRIDSDYDLSEIHPEKTRPGKIDYISVGLMIHNKELFMLQTDGTPVKIDENGFVLSKKHNSSTPPGPLPLNTYKNSEDEE